MTRQLSFVRYGLILSLCSTSTVSCFAQGYRSKQTIYSHEQSQQLFGFEAHGSNYGVQTDYDSYGTYLTVSNNELAYASYNNGSVWNRIVAPEITHDITNSRPFRRIVETGGGKALASTEPFRDARINSTFVTDNNSASRIGSYPPNSFIRATISDLHPNSMRDGELVFTGYGLPLSYPTGLFEYSNGSSQLVYNQRFIDPQTGQSLNGIHDAQLYTDGIVFHSDYVDPALDARQYGVFTVQNGQLNRLFNLRDILGNDFQSALLFSNSLQYSAGNFLLNTIDFDRYTRDTYFVGSDRQALNVFDVYDTIPELNGSISNIQSLLDGDVVLQLCEVSIENAGNWERVFALVRWQNGQYEIIDTLDAPENTVHILQKFAYGQAFIARDYSDTGPSNAFAYSIVQYNLNAVPEPGSVALFACLAVMGLAYTRRKRRN